MKAALATAVFPLVLSVNLAAQQHGGAAQPAAEHGAESSGGHGPGIGWKWANFVLLAGGLGYLIGRHAPAFFRSRDLEIQQGLAEAARIKKEADERVAEVARKLQSLESEIAVFRQTSRAEMSAEQERIQAETARDFAKIQAQAAQEIASAANVARNDLKAYAADLAVRLARERVRTRLTPDADAALVDTFLKDLRDAGPAARGD